MKVSEKERLKEREWERQGKRDKCMMTSGNGQVERCKEGGKMRGEVREGEDRRIGQV